MMVNILQFNETTSRNKTSSTEKDSFPTRFHTHSWLRRIRRDTAVPGADLIGAGLGALKVPAKFHDVA